MIASASKNNILLAGASLSSCFFSSEEGAKVFLLEKLINHREYRSLRGAQFISSANQYRGPNFVIPKKNDFPTFECPGAQKQENVW